MRGKVFMPLGQTVAQGYSNTTGTQSEVLSLRLPIFNQNKPYLFLKISKDTDKYRLSLSPDFLKQYNLSFRIFRNKSLDELIKNLDQTSRLNTNFNKLDFRLPKKELQEVIKLNFIMDLKDDGTDVINLEKYIFMSKTNVEETVVFISERITNGITNLCLSFISKKYKSLEEFLKDLDSK